MTVFGRVPVEPDRDAARDWAVRELSGREYAQARPGLLERAIRWLRDHLPDSTGADLSPWLVLAVLAVFALLALYALHRSGGFATNRRRAADPVLSDPRRDAADHRAAADRYAADADYTMAVIERFRAIARELEERAVLTPQPGRTADEISAEAGRWLPELQRHLATGAHLFDDVRYGDRRATPDMEARLRDLDAAVQRARPAAEPVPAIGWPTP